MDTVGKDIAAALGLWGKPVDSLLEEIASLKKDRENLHWIKKAIRHELRKAAERICDEMTAIEGEPTSASEAG